MTAHELIQVLLAFENRLDVQWGVFITVHLALFGGIIYIDGPLKRGEKIAAMVIYFGFATINYLVSADLAASIHAAQTEIAKFTSEPCCLKNELVARISAKVAGVGPAITQVVLILSHAIMLLLVLLSVVFDRRVSEPGVSAAPSDEAHS